DYPNSRFKLRSSISSCHRVRPCSARPALWSAASFSIACRSNHPVLASSRERPSAAASSASALRNQ
ncbi:conserved hypothetical protein, partial [Ricinus communis]